MYDSPCRIIQNIEDEDCDCYAISPDECKVKYNHYCCYTINDPELCLDTTHGYLSDINSKENYN
jgi:hypothetical protein